MIEKLKNSRYQLLVAVPLAVLIGILASTSPVNLDDLKSYISLYPGKTGIAVGDSFSVAVTIDSKLDFNAVEATIEFPKEFLAIDSVSYEDSIINLWIEEPNFSNDSGTLKFSGIITSPGYVGKRNVFEIHFKAKKSGIANVNFSNASVLANDGKGTEILEKEFGAIYSIKGIQASDLDFNGDGKLNISDISILVSKLNDSSADAMYDLNMDGKVNLMDLSIVLSRTSRK